MQFLQVPPTLLPAGMRVRFTSCIVPYKLPAAIIRTRVFVVPDPITLLQHRRTRQHLSTHPRENRKLETLHVQVSESEYMVEELAVLGGPSDLHHPRRDGRHLVVPDARIHAERAAHALKRRGVAAGLRGGTNRGERVCVWLCVARVKISAKRDRQRAANSRLTSRPVGEIFRYSLTSLLLSIALMLARLTFS